MSKTPGKKVEFPWISWKNIPSPPAYFCWCMLDQKFPKHLEPDVWTCSFAPANILARHQHWKPWQVLTTKYLLKEGNGSHIRMGLSLAWENMKENLAIPLKSSRKITSKQNFSVPLALALLPWNWTADRRIKCGMFHRNLQKWSMIVTSQSMQFLQLRDPKLLPLFLTITSLRTNYHHGVISRQRHKLQIWK